MRNKNTNLYSQQQSLVMPAFMTNMSRRSSRWKLSAKLITKAKSARSTFQNSHAFVTRSGSDVFDGMSKNPRDQNVTRDGGFSLALVATLPGFIHAKRLAASKPRPELAPTTAIVFPERSVVSSGGTVDHTSRRKLRIDLPKSIG